MFYGECGAEDGEAGLRADGGGEGYMGLVEIGGAPGEGLGIEGCDEDIVTVGIGAAVKLRKQEASC